VTKTVQPCFEWSDSWVFTSLYMTTKHQDNLNLAMLIGCCDMLNHSIVSRVELDWAFTKFLAYRLVSLDGSKVSYSELGMSIKDLAERRKGGLFSRVDLTLRCMNSRKNGLLHRDFGESMSFFSDEEIAHAYEKYVGKNG